MIKQRNLTWLIPLLLFITFPAWRIPVGRFLTPPITHEHFSKLAGKDSRKFKMETVKIVDSKQGRTTSEIRAATALTSTKPNEYILNTVNADIFNKAGEITNVVADKGIFNKKSKILTLIDNVVIYKIKDRQHLYTSLLVYDDNRQTVHCPGPTKMNGDGIEVKGSSFDYEIDKGHYEVGGRVHCLIQSTFTP